MQPVAAHSESIQAKRHFNIVLERGIAALISFALVALVAAGVADRRRKPSPTTPLATP
jgi:hypothetical protein